MEVNKNCPAKCSNKRKELVDKCVTNRNNEDSINFGQPPPPPTSLLLFANVICDQNLNHLAGSYSSLFISSPQITNKIDTTQRNAANISKLVCYGAGVGGTATVLPKKGKKYSSVSCGSSLSLFKCACKR